MDIITCDNKKLIVLVANNARDGCFCQPRGLNDPAPAKVWLTIQGNVTRSLGPSFTHTKGLQTNKSLYKMYIAAFLYEAKFYNFITVIFT